MARKILIVIDMQNAEKHEAALETMRSCQIQGI